MVAVLADERTLVVLDSPDLKHWTKRSTFGPAGDTAGQWECPDLIELPVEDSRGKKVGADHQSQSGSAGGRNGGPLPDWQVRWHELHQRSSRHSCALGRLGQGLLCHEHMERPAVQRREASVDWLVQQLAVCQRRTDRAMARSAIHSAHLDAAPLRRWTAPGAAPGARNWKACGARRSASRMSASPRRTRNPRDRDERRSLRVRSRFGAWESRRNRLSPAQE